MKHLLKKRLHIDASRLKSGGGVLHLIKLLELEKYSSFDEIIVYTYQNSEFKKLSSKKIIIKTHPYINKNIFYKIFWQRYLMKKNMSSFDLLFTIDSTSFCSFKNNVVLNQDLIGFQNGSYKYFTLKNKVISYLKYFVAKKAMKSSKANIFTTSYALDEVTKKIGALKNTNVIPHGIDSEFLTKKLNYEIAENSLKVIYVSSIFDYKNHKYLISALNSLPTTRKVIAYFVGGGDMSLIKKLKAHSINRKGNKFHFLGFLARPRVYELTRECDIAVFLSSVECFGITLLEYMRMGMPIICSNESSMPEILDNSGLLVSPSDEASIIRSITELELNQNKRVSLGEKAYNFSLKYSWDNTAIKTYSLLAKVYEEALQNDLPTNLAD